MAGSYSRMSEISDLPNDLWENILFRLPLKFLKRLRCVSKSWRALIDSDAFVQSHIRQSSATNSRQHLILRGIKVFVVDLDNADKANLLVPPFECRSYHRISSCNGLILVETDPPVLWNPFSKSYKVLRGPQRTPWGSCPVAKYGFAFDSSNNDYKIVRFVMHRDLILHKWMEHRTEIYSLKRDSWKGIDNFPYPLPILNGPWGVHVEGELYTLVREAHCPAKIMAFDVRTEEHHEMGMPSCIDSNKDMNLDAIAGCLSLICIDNISVVIWILEGYGTGKAWKRMMSINQPATVPYETVKLLVYSKDRRRVLLNCNEHSLIWCGLGEGMEVVQFSVDDSPYKFNAMPCVESLVSFHDKATSTSQCYGDVVMRRDPISTKWFDEFCKVLPSRIAN